MKVNNNLIKGNETKAMITFATPMIIGNMFQQLYNVADSIIVGKFIGPDLNSSRVFFYSYGILTSIILGLCG